MSGLEGGLRCHHIANNRIDQGTSMFGLIDFTCGAQEAVSDRARRPEFTRKNVTITQRH